MGKHLEIGNPPNTDRVNPPVTEIQTPPMPVVEVAIPDVDLDELGDLLELDLRGPRHEEK